MAGERFRRIRLDDGKDCGGTRFTMIPNGSRSRAPVRHSDTGRRQAAPKI
jgi:hypothetical protein